MALEHGSLSLRRYFPAKALPNSKSEAWFDRLNEHRLRELESLEPDAENGGWAVMGNELCTEFHEKNVVYGPYVGFSYRRDTIRLPSGLVDLHLKALVSVEEEVGEVVDRIQRQRMKEDIEKDLLASVHPNIESAGVLVDTSRQVVYFASTSDRLADEFLMLFYQSWGIQLIEADWETSAFRLLPGQEEQVENILARPALHLVEGLETHPDYEDDPITRLGSAFLTWFYHYLQTTDSVWASDEIEEVSVYADDTLSLAGENMGSREITLKKGSISTCRELSAAFAAGKSVSKAKLIFYRGDEEQGRQWSFVMEKRKACLSGLKLPRPEIDHPRSIILERFDSIAEIHDIMDDIYRDFLLQRSGDEWPEILEGMRNWIREMDGGIEAMGDLPEEMEHKEVVTDEGSDGKEDLSDGSGEVEVVRVEEVEKNELDEREDRPETEGFEKLEADEESQNEEKLPPFESKLDEEGEPVWTNGEFFLAEEEAEELEEEKTSKILG
jgi:hypothetical protein